MSQMSPLMFEIVANDRSRAAFDSVGRSAANTNARIESLSRSSNQAMRGMQANVSNLAAQFQDIGVQLAGGQSPFLIALQQGTQISAVLGQAGAAGAVRTLGGAFASLLSPMSLATIGIIGLGGAAAQYFATMLMEGEQSSEVMRQQNDIIAQVARTWGDAYPALQAYADELERVRKNSDLGQASEIAAQRQYQPIVDVMQEINQEYTAAIRNLRGFGSETDQVVRALTASMADLQTKIMDGTATSEDMAKASQALGEAVDDYGTPAVIALARAFETLLPKIGAAIDAAATFRNQASGLSSLSNYPTQGAYSFWEENGKLMNEADFQPFGTAPVPTPRGTPELSGFPWEKLNASRSGGARAAEAEANAYAKVVQSLQDELDMIGRSKTDQRILELQRRANAEASTTEGQKIDMLVRKIEEKDQAMKDAAKSASFMQDALKGSIMSFIPEIETGNAALDTFINKLAQASAEALLFGTGPFAGGAGGGSGLVGSLLSGFGFGGGRAVGGAVDPYTDYLVGESGPEIVRIGARGGYVGSAPRERDSAGGKVTVQIINNTGAQVREERENSNGQDVRRFIIGTVQDATASGEMDRSNRGRFGLGPQKVIR